jgi:hypothetical protein
LDNTWAKVTIKFYAAKGLWLCWASVLMVRFDLLSLIKAVSIGQTYEDSLSALAAWRELRAGKGKYPDILELLTLSNCTL